MTDSTAKPATASRTLFNTLDAALISVNIELSSSKKLLEEMARLLTIPLHEEIREKDVYHHLLEREKLGNTGIGNGVALPHSRFAETSQAVVAIITLETPIDYDSADRQAVDVAFGLLVPDNANQEHLNLLADIARLMSNPTNKCKLSGAATPSQVIALIDQWSA